MQPCVVIDSAPRHLSFSNGQADAAGVSAKGGLLGRSLHLRNATVTSGMLPCAPIG